MNYVVTWQMDNATNHMAKNHLLNNIIDKHLSFFDVIDKQLSNLPFSSNLWKFFWGPWHNLVLYNKQAPLILDTINCKSCVRIPRKRNRLRKEYLIWQRDMEVADQVIKFFKIKYLLSQHISFPWKAWFETTFASLDQTSSLLLESSIDWQQLRNIKKL